MAWSNKAMKALQDWLRPSTWYKRHPLDEGRFYEFILAVWSEHHELWDQELARHLIQSEAQSLHPRMADQSISKYVEESLSIGTLILDFLTQLEEKGRLQELVGE